MKIYCQECGAANETGLKECRICHASLPHEGTKPDYGKYNFEASPAPVKVMVDGQLYILRDGKAYSPNGQIVIQ